MLSSGKEFKEQHRVPRKNRETMDSVKYEKMSSVKIVVGSTTPDHLEIVLSAFEKWHPPVSTIVVPKEVESKATAIDRMIACTAEMAEITKQEFAIAVGIENENGVAVRFYKNGYYFDYHTKSSTLSEACFTAFQRLGNIAFHDAVMKEEFDTVLIFGTFDLFHELHKKLLDAAAVIGKEVIVYVNEDNTKFKRAAITGDIIKESKNNMIDSPEKRRRNVATYLGLKGVVKLKQGKHIDQLTQAIKQCHAQGKTVALFGGNDQFENFPKLLDLCYQTKIPIITQPRGETDTLLCTTDLKNKRQYQQLAKVYTLELENINSAFFKKRIESKEDAVKYLLKLTEPSQNPSIPNDQILGMNEAELWQYHSLDKSIQRLLKGGYHKNDKILLCLPGRSRCNVARAKKILHTIHDQFVPKDMKHTVTCFVACYKQEEKTTATSLEGLNANPLGFFSDDALSFTKLLILPRITGKMHEIKAALAGITLWARSYGSVIAIEMENAFRALMLSLKYTENEIVELGKEICVISMSNLAPLERPRLFTTLSVTGFNDLQAKKYITNFPKHIKNYYRPEEMLSQNFISTTHNVVMVDVPEKFTEVSTGRIITDPNRHYTPNYDSIRKSPLNNACPILIHKELELMLQRSSTFDLKQTERLDFKGLNESCQRTLASSR